METDQGYEVKQQNRGEGHPGGCLESRMSKKFIQGPSYAGLKRCNLRVSKCSMSQYYIVYKLHRYTRTFFTVLQGTLLIPLLTTLQPGLEHWSVGAETQSTT